MCGVYAWGLVYPVGCEVISPFAAGLDGHSVFWARTAHERGEFVHFGGGRRTHHSGLNLVLDFAVFVHEGDDAVRSVSLHHSAHLMESFLVVFHAVLVADEDRVVAPVHVVRTEDSGELLEAADDDVLVGHVRLYVFAVAGDGPLHYAGVVNPVDILHEMVAGILCPEDIAVDMVGPDVYRERSDRRSDDYRTCLERCEEFLRAEGRDVLPVGC